MIWLHPYQQTRYMRPSPLLSPVTSVFSVAVLTSGSKLTKRAKWGASQVKLNWMSGGSSLSRNRVAPLLPGPSFYNWKCLDIAQRTSTQTLWNWEEGGLSRELQEMRMTPWWSIWVSYNLLYPGQDIVEAFSQEPPISTDQKNSKKSLLFLSTGPKTGEWVE